MSTLICFAIGGIVITFIAIVIVDLIFARLMRKDRDEAVARFEEAIKHSESRMEERMREARKHIKP